MSLSNAVVGELLARRAEEVPEPQRAKAYRRAARAALMWEQECAALLAGGRSLTELERVGDRLAGRIEAWLEHPPEIPEPPPIRSGFITFAEVCDEIFGGRDGRFDADLHMHTTASDGRDSLLDMALASSALGRALIAVTDHLAGARAVPRGLAPSELSRQKEEVARVNDYLEREGIELKVLHGAEVNIDRSGRLEADPALLRSLDLVIGSFHSDLRLTEDQTDRYVAALRDPSLDVLGHPRGRVYNRRMGLNAEWRVVLEAARDEGKAVEIDCYPDRQDLDVELARLAGEVGTTVSVGTDAHNTEELRFLEVGMVTARRAALAGERVLNGMTMEGIAAWKAGR